MKELSLHILDIAQNSITAGATRIEITLELKGDGHLSMTIRDNGKGMSPAFLEQVRDPFYTTRTTRQVGMGLPLLSDAIQQTGGELEIESTRGMGTTVRGTFDMNNIDCAPVGDMGSTMATLIQSSPALTFVYTQTTPKGQFVLDTEELREALGEGVPLDTPEVVLWIRDYMKEQTITAVNLTSAPPPKAGEQTTKPLQYQRPT